jgi:hypothetical protein
MADEPPAGTLRAELFADPELNVYAVLDGASAPDLLDHLYGDRPEFYCLFRGELEPDMAEVAPYLVQLAGDAPFTQWLLGEGWGKHWGIFAASAEEVVPVRHHFRALVSVYDETGKPLLFRFYDPRVMRTFLPTCNAGELAEVFGPVAAYRMEAEDPAVLLSFRNEDGTLETRELALAGP